MRWELNSGLLNAKFEINIIYFAFAERFGMTGHLGFSEKWIQQLHRNKM